MTTERNGARVQLEFTLTNQLPAALAGMFRDVGDQVGTRRAGREAAAAEEASTRYVRTERMPGIPQVGDEVEVNPNWDPIVVERMFWRVDPPGGGEPVAVVILGDLDEDVVGEGTAQELLEEAGWVVEPDQ